MKIGILGGSFNPPHLGHYLISQQLIDFGFVSQVWLMPNFSHVWGKKLAPASDRLAMCQFLVNEKIKISTLEIDQQKALATIDTLKLLEKKFPKHQFFWLLGEKNLKDLPKWQGYPELIRQYSFLVLPQNSSDLKLEIRNSLKIKNLKLKIIRHPLWIQTSISSSIIRQRIKLGLSLKGFVPEAVASYIEKRRLYKV